MKKALILLIMITGCTQVIPSDTLPTGTGSITINEVGSFNFKPADITSIRPDIFKPGHFSIFDILAYLDEQGDIDVDYYFNESMNTHVITSINGVEDWWYITYYDGGWPENNVFRMDHYPYKDEMYIRLIRDDASMIESIYEEFTKEIQRKESNNGALIIPEVIIRGPNLNLRFTNVNVTPHNLRNDTFQLGVITAIDTIMSLADQGRITYELTWYESIGSAGIVKSYWVEKINNAEAFSTCGFVYEAGSWTYEGFRGNHIHLPSDWRVINSPEYLEYFWICL